MPARAIDGENTPPCTRSQRLSPAASTILESSDSTSVAIVTSRTGSHKHPFRINRPLTPTEISPLMLLMPECRPLTSHT